MRNLISRIPTLGWIVLIPLGLALFIGGIAAVFWAISSTEGVASACMLVAGAVFIRFTYPPDSNQSGRWNLLTRSKPRTTEEKIGLAISVFFFSLMGVAIDQPGNFVYNKPLEILSCPAGTALYRTTSTTHPKPGSTRISQNFNCLDSNGAALKKIGILELLMHRFLLYAGIFHILLGLNRFVPMRKHRANQEEA